MASVTYTSQIKKISSSSNNL